MRHRVELSPKIPFVCVVDQRPKELLDVLIDGVSPVKEVEAKLIDSRPRLLRDLPRSRLGLPSRRLSLFDWPSSTVSTQKR